MSLTKYTKAMMTRVWLQVCSIAISVTIDILNQLHSFFCVQLAGLPYWAAHRALSKRLWVWLVCLYILCSNAVVRETRQQIRPPPNLWKQNQRGYFPC
ncbi:hypothetical protein O9929_13225 [Vibrio lentus]|nr:hypothetical protein [Vibrio lentus]